MVFVIMQFFTAVAFAIWGSAGIRAHSLGADELAAADYRCGSGGFGESMVAVDI